MVATSDPGEFWVTLPRTAAIPLLLILFVLLSAGCAAPRQAARGGFDMPYPVREAPSAGDIYHVPTGLKMTLDGAMDMIAGARLVFVGETHDNIHAHEVELAVIRELDRRFPGRVAIGMEMFRVPQQEALDRWTRGELSERDFLKEAKWYENWGSDFGYYRDILLFARDNGIDVIALNPSRELEREVRKGGVDNVAEDLRGALPEIGPIDPYQRDALKAVYGDHIPSEGMFESFLRTQVLWEETMAERVVAYLESPRGAGKTMVTLTGGWHVRYGIGLPRKVLRRMAVPYVIVLPQEIAIPEGKRDRLMDVELPEIPLLPADFVWMVPYEDLEDRQVRMGVLLREGDGAMVVEAVTPGSPADKAGIEKGDAIVSLDGEPISDMADIRILLGGKGFGDRSAVSVVRDGEEKTFDLEFFRLPKVGRH
jgi:uncharacterized iron-regulated protein